MWQSQSRQHADLKQHLYCETVQYSVDEDRCTNPTVMEWPGSCSIVLDRQKQAGRPMSGAVW